MEMTGGMRGRENKEEKWGRWGGGRYRVERKGGRVGKGGGGRVRS